jgi:hypothetical protein
MILLNERSRREERRRRGMEIKLSLLLPSIESRGLLIYSLNLLLRTPFSDSSRKVDSSHLSLVDLDEKK